MNDNDKRKYERMNVINYENMDVEVSSIFTRQEMVELKSLNKKMPFKSMDISAGGISFKSSIELPLNLRIKLLIKFHDGVMDDMELVSKLVRVIKEEDGYVYGCKFINPKHYEIEILINYVDIHKGDEA